MNDERLAKIIEAMKKIRELHGKKRGVVGVIECPQCGGKLHYSISSYNGHVHLKCKTENCIGWMQ